jgi:SSS family solute:Na+ symporter
MSMVVYTASLAMITMIPEPITSISRSLGVSHPIYSVIVAVGVAATVYACVGGIRAVIWTDVLQAFMLFGGVVLIIGYVMASDGSGVGTWWRTITANAEHPPRIVWFGTDIAERTTVLWAFTAVVFWNVCTHCCDQVALQRYFTTRSLTAARRSFIVNVVSAASIGILLGLSGLALRYYYLQHPQRLVEGVSATSGADQLMPMFFSFELPMGCAGLILVSFLCDAMQTLGSGVNSIAAIINRDIAQHGDARLARSVRSARFTTLAVGFVASLLAVMAAGYALHSKNTIFDMLPRMFNMFLGPLAIMFMIGMFYRRATGGVVLAVTLITQVVSSLWSWWGDVPVVLDYIGLPQAAEAWTSILGVESTGKLRIPSVMLAVAGPTVFGLILGAIASALFGRSQHPGADYTRRAVLLRPVEEE